MVASVVSDHVGGSTVTFRDGEAEDVTELADCVALTAQVPSTSDPRSHDPVEAVAVNEQVTFA
jgi:hypothetical protein